MVPSVPQFGSWVASPMATARDPLAGASDSVSIARAASLVAGLLAPVTLVSKPPVSVVFVWKGLHVTPKYYKTFYLLKLAKTF